MGEGRGGGGGEALLLLTFLLRLPQEAYTIWQPN